jgi:hypothetical protein
LEINGICSTHILHWKLFVSNGNDLFVFKFELIMVRKKHILVFAILLLVIILSAAFLVQRVRKINTKKEEYQSIPSFSLLNLEGMQITEKTLKKNTASLFLFF